MAALVRLVSPKGEAQSVDPDEFDVAGMLADGFKRVPLSDTVRVTVREHQRNRPAARRPAGGGADFSTPPETSFGRPLKQIEDLKNLAVNVGGAAGGMLLAPAVEGPVLAGSLARFAPAIGGAVTRAAGSLLGGGLTRAAVDAGTGQEGVGGALPAGMEQAGYSLAGEPVAGALGMLGRGAMGVALKFTPEVAQTAIHEGITATRGGVKKLLSKLGDYGQRTAAMVRRNPQTFHPTDILEGGGQKLVAEISDNQTGLAPERMETYTKLARDFVRRHTTATVEHEAAQEAAATSRQLPLSNNYTPRRTRHMPPRTTSETQALSATQLQRFKQQAHDIADPIFKRLARNEQVTPTENATASWYKAMGDWAQETLERTTPDMINPVTGKAMSLAESNAQTGRLIELKSVLAPDVRTERGFGARLMEKAASPAGRMVSGATIGAGAGAAIPGGNNAHDALLGALLGGGLASPQLMSMLALALSHGGVQAAARQAPRGLMMAAHE